jgi:hypothetical protein
MTLKKYYDFTNKEVPVVKRTSSPLRARNVFNW